MAQAVGVIGAMPRRRRQADNLQAPGRREYRGSAPARSGNGPTVRACRNHVDMVVSPPQERPPPPTAGSGPFCEPLPRRSSHVSSHTRVSPASDTLIVPISTRSAILHPGRRPSAEAFVRRLPLAVALREVLPVRAGSQPFTNSGCRTLSDPDRHLASWAARARSGPFASSVQNASPIADLRQSRDLNRIQTARES
jgi:hypothetical protein